MKADKATVNMFLQSILHFASTMQNALPQLPKDSPAYEAIVDQLREIDTAIDMAADDLDPVNFN